MKKRACGGQKDAEGWMAHVPPTRAERKHQLFLYSSPLKEDRTGNSEAGLLSLSPIETANIYIYPGYRDEIRNSITPSTSPKIPGSGHYTPQFAGDSPIT